LELILTVLPHSFTNYLWN